MLSILIPTYNYNAFPLVKALHDQALTANIVFEILVADDASTDLEAVKKNQAITELTSCKYHCNATNLGRGENRNSLIQKAAYSWVLLMDCDTFPTASSFLKNYIHSLNTTRYDVYFGGIAYEEKPPKNEEVLRWIYGQKREAISLERRQKKPYESTLVSNILIKKELLLSHPFHSSIYDYGFEDFVFIAELKKNNISICQIDNPAFHLNLEKSTVFLKKHLTALDNLHALIAQKIIHPKDTSLSKLHFEFVRFKVDKLMVLLFNLFGATIKRNLISKKPSILLFDFYKLGYFCAIKHS